jgi:N-acetylglutamate synthase-like GNAT family acetyltransferase
MMIREMRVSDINQVFKLLQSYILFGEATVEYASSLVKQLSLVAFEGELVVGFITLKEKAEVSHLCVQEQFRGRGISRLLLESILHKTDARRLIANGWITPHGWEAERVFKALGFIEESRGNLWASECNSKDFCPHYSGICNCNSVLVSLER